MVDHESASPEPFQFRLVHALLGVTLACVVFAVVRLLPEPVLSLRGGLLAGICWIGILFAIGKVCGDSAGTVPMLGASFGTIGGAGAYGVLLVAGVDVGAHRPELPGLLLIVALVLVYGSMWGAAFLLVGYLAAGIYRVVRGRHDAWSGVICGAATGFAATAPVFFFLEPTRQLWLHTSIPTLIGALFGGFGALVQIHGARRRNWIAESRAAALEIGPPADSAPET